MSTEELRQAGQALYGHWGWQTRLAETLCVNGSTVKRWVSGKTPIPSIAVVAIHLLLRVQELEAQ